MRMFDLRNSWLDNDGKPLAGRISFCKLHTTVPENVFDISGTPLDNPVYTNTIGQLVDQVFLADRTDYTVRFEKYVGNGDMMTDPEGWLFQYSADNLWNTYGISVESTTFQLVNNISDLRLLHPEHVTERDGREVIILGGYNVIGDKPQVTYVWNPDSIENDDGGSVIKVDDIATGRWELVNTFGIDGIDVRHFGVFGAASREAASDTMSLKISLANSYATSIGLPLYFPSLDGLTWYKVNGLNISGALFASDTRVFGNTGTESVITVTDPDTWLSVFENSDYSARFTIRGNEVHTSWGTGCIHVKFEPEYRLVIDSTLSTIYKAWSGIVVDVLVDCSGCSFDGCIINSVGKLGDGTELKNERITERMFSEGTDYATVEVFDTDEIYLDDFQSVSNWLVLAMQVFTGGTIDFRGRIVDSTCEVNYTASAVSYRNAIFDGFRVKQASVSFDRCSGSITTDTLSSITLTDTVLYITDSTIGIIPAVAVNRSTVTLDTAATISNLSINGSTFATSAYRPVTNVACVDSTLQSAITVNGNCTFSNSTVNAPVLTSPSGFSFIGCTFNAPHIVSVVMPNTAVSGQWIGNFGTVENPVQFNVTTGSLLADDSQHPYAYEDNTGTFLPTSVEFDVEFDQDHIDQYSSGSYEMSYAGRCSVYVKDSKDIIMVYPWGISADYPVFHIGAETKYRMKIGYILNYTTFTTNRILDTGVVLADKIGDVPNSTWIREYLHLPISGRLDNNVPTVVYAAFRVECSKTRGNVITGNFG